MADQDERSRQRKPAGLLLHEGTRVLLESLPADERGRALGAILAAFEGCEIEDAAPQTRTGRAAAARGISDIKADLDAYAATCRQNAENQRRRWDAERERAAAASAAAAEIAPAAPAAPKRSRKRSEQPRELSPEERAAIRELVGEDETEAAQESNTTQQPEKHQPTRDELISSIAAAFKNPLGVSK